MADESLRVNALAAYEALRAEADAKLRRERPDIAARQDEIFSLAQSVAAEALRSSSKTRRKSMAKALHNAARPPKITITHEGPVVLLAVCAQRER
jgi:hypothetical protein